MLAPDQPDFRVQMILYSDSFKLDTPQVNHQVHLNNNHNHLRLLDRIQQILTIFNLNLTQQNEISYNGIRGITHTGSAYPTNSEWSWLTTTSGIVCGTHS